MLLYTMLYIVLAYLMLFAALTNSVCLNNASFFFKYFLCQGYELSGEIALKNNHYYYYLCSTNQSEYRPGHSTETAHLKVVNDLFLYLLKGNMSILALLDFSFDKIDHFILVHRLHTDFGFTDAFLQWFSSYLTDRTHYVSISNHCSALAPVHSGVPQGSVIDPKLFSTYIKPLHIVIDLHSITHSSFADDT